MRVVSAIEKYASLKSASTCKSYLNILSLISEHLGHRIGSVELERAIKNFTREDAISFLAWLKKRRTPDGGVTSDNTMHQRIAIARKLFRHLFTIGLIKHNAFFDITDAVPLRRRRQKRPTKLIPTEKIEQILNMPNPDTKHGVRDRAILALLFGGGLRRSEVIGLNVGDVMLSMSGVPYVQLRETKAGVTQQQSLPEWAHERIAALVLQRKTEKASSNDPLFVFYSVAGKAKRRLSDSTLKRHFKEYCAAAGVEDVSPHAARATAATVLKSEGYEDREVANFLRHTNTIMVGVYDKRYRGVETNPGRELNYRESLNKKIQ